MIIEIESMEIKRAEIKTDIIKMKTDMKGNQGNTTPDTPKIETLILQIKTKILKTKTETIQTKF